ncbi:hypothetical protein [Mycobacterium sp.]|uniref:hypothetical protein n=1 Tax=Mycobacterium sp. TaxID=1785 RepID=UPI0025EDEF65|nr:hypothetical protein [Mycobacterium sp.]
MTSTAIAGTVVALGWVGYCGHAAAEPPAPAPQPKTTIDHDGTYAVGTDIVPGTYSSAGPVNGGTCYWKRVGSDEDNKTVIIDNAMSKKPQVVQIDPGDKAFKTDGCQPWQKTDTATPDPGKSPAEVKLPLDILNRLAGPPGGAPPAP